MDIKYSDLLKAITIINKDPFCRKIMKIKEELMECAKNGRSEYRFEVFEWESNKILEWCRKNGFETKSKIKRDSSGYDIYNILLKW